MNDITPISNSKRNNNHSGNSNIFSETTQKYALLNIPNNNITQTDDELTNLNINKNKVEIELKTKEENNIIIILIYENNLYDASLEYSKSKSNIGNDNPNSNISNLNKNI